MLRTSLCRTFLSTLIALAVFWVAAVCGSPVPPTQDAEVIQQYLNHLSAATSDVDLYGYLQHQALRAPARAHGAWGRHASQVNVQLDRGYHAPSAPPPGVLGVHPFPVNAAPNQAYNVPLHPHPLPRFPSLRSGSGTRRGAILADSTLVSVAPQEAQLVHDTVPSSHPPIPEGVPMDFYEAGTSQHRPILEGMPLGFYGTHPSPHLPVLDGVPVGVHAGLPAYGRTQPALANPILEHQPPQLPLGSEVPPTFDASATPSQKIDHVASPEEAAGPSKPPVDEEASSSKLVGATKGFTYRTVLHPDPEVDAFIAAMRERRF